MPEAFENKIQFHFPAGSFYLSKRTELKNFILKLLKREGKKVQHINYIFCSDEYLLGLNKAYLKHNTLTDIITFDLSENSNKLMSDVYISIERVRENAILFEVSFGRELTRVIFHGALHLAGYMDKSAGDVKLMRAKEDEYLNKWFHVERRTKRH